MNKLKIAAGSLLTIAVLYLAYSYIETQRQIAENGRYQQNSYGVLLDTRTGATYKMKHDDKPVKIGEAVDKGE
jgi:hypothetical protein